jgi:hypothetical protein
MKKYLLALTFSIITIGTFAQTIRYGLKAGVNLAKFVSDNSNYQSAKLYTGFNFGGIMDIDYGNITIQPGLIFTAKGERNYAPLAAGSMGGSASYVNYAVHYLELPVNILINFDIAKPVKFQLGGGPYFAYNIGNDVNWYYYKKTDVGANLFAGFVLDKKYLLNAQYGFGISDATKGDDMQNRVLSFSVGYLFK